jgi:hypothetical protein
MDNNWIEHIENARDNILEQTKEDLKDLMNDTQRYQKFCEITKKNLESNYNSIE